MGGLTMNENLDLVKILDGCPEGTEFYHLIYGKVQLAKILPGNDYPIRLSISGCPCDNTCLTTQGLLFKEFNGECLLYPSKDQRDWSKFERFWDKSKVEKFDPNTLQPFDKVLGFYEVEGGSWECALFSHLNETERSAVCTGIIYDKCIPYNEETKHLMGTNDDCPEYYK